jgi:hypothetical protein
MPKESPLYTPKGTARDRSELLEAIMRELKKDLSLGQNHLVNEKDSFMRACYYGYTDGLKRAIDIINIEIGLRQNPPNINYPGERPL